MIAYATAIRRQELHQMLGNISNRIKFCERDIRHTKDNPFKKERHEGEMSVLCSLKNDLETRLIRMNGNGLGDGNERG